MSNNSKNDSVDDEIILPPPEESHADDDNIQNIRLLLDEMNLEQLDIARPLYGTWNDLTSYLIIPFNADLEYRDAFLLTLCDFASAEELAKALSLELISDNVGNRVQTIGSNKTDLGIFSKEDMKSFVSRKEWILDIFRVWLERYAMDFSIDVINVIKAYTNNFHPHWDAMVLNNSKRLQKVFDKLQLMLNNVEIKRAQALSIRRGVTKRASLTSMSFLKKFTDDNTGVHILKLNVKPLCIANQLTISQWNKFKKISCRELLSMQYFKGTVQTTHWEAAPTILSYITYHNKQTIWVIEQIKLCKNNNETKKTVTYFLDVINECINLGNFESAFAIIGGLRTIKNNDRNKIWKNLSNESIKLWKSFERIISPDHYHRDYREQYELLVETNSFRIPFIGIIIGSLRGLCPRWEINEAAVVAEIKKYVNFSRRMGAYRIIENVRLAQNFNVEIEENHRILVALNESITIIDSIDNGQIFYGFPDDLLLSYPRVMSGKPRYLVHYLLSSYGRDEEFRSAFFLCFEDFVSIDDLLKFMLYELEQIPEHRMEHLYSNDPEERKLELAQDKSAILKCIQHWMWDYPIDFTTEMFQKIENKVNKLPDKSWEQHIGPINMEILNQNFQDFKASINVAIDRRNKLLRNKNVQRRISSSATPRFVQKMVQSGPSLKLYKFSPHEIAEQLTLIQHELFINVHLRELTQCRWMSKNKQQDAPIVLSYIAHHNKLSNWVGQEILSQEKSEKRVTTIMLMIQIANECIKIGNFDTAFAIIGGLSSAPIFRLKLTWKRIEEMYRKMFDNILQLTSTKNNYRQYRIAIDRLALKKLPFIPFLGVILSDLVKIHTNAQQTSRLSQVSTEESSITSIDSDINESILSARSDSSIDGKFVDFTEYLSVYRLLQRVKQSQDSLFPFDANLELQMILREGIMKCVVENQQKLYTYSLRAEPKDQKLRQAMELLEIIEAVGL